MREIHEQPPYPPSSATDLYIALHISLPDFQIYSWDH